MSTSNSTNIFQEVLTDAQGVETKLLGPVYPYYKNINTPSSIGMSSDGSLSALDSDVKGLIAYVQLLVEGTGSANGNKAGQNFPLGNKYFLKTGAKCKDTKTSEEVDRYIYVNNVPNGNIPFISSGLGTDFTMFKGLIPGAMSDLNVLNPYSILQSFTSGSLPDCESLTMQVIDNSGNVSTDTNYVTLTDIQNMDPCNFPGNTNLVTGKSCTESFTNNTTEKSNNYSNYNLDDNSILNGNYNLPKDPTVQLYFLGLASLGIYILYKIMEKSK